MKTKTQIGLWLPISLAMGAICYWQTLAFLGVLDTGQFDVMQTEWILPHKVAILARRSDNAALSGNTFFVVIADRIYSSKELSKSLHLYRYVFSADRDGIVLYWAGPNKLIIRCEVCGITPDRINRQRFSDGATSIQYVGFP